MKNQKREKILLFMHSLHGYSEEVVKNLKDRNFDVTHFPHSSKVPKRELSPIGRIARLLSKNTNIKKFKESYFNFEKEYYTPRILESLHEYDLILSIGGCCSASFMKLVAENSKTKKILFIWDDLKFDETSQGLLRYFDKVYTYSKEDAESYNLHYLSNFYLDAFKYNQESKDIDIFYIGSMREKERLEALHLIDSHTQDYTKNLKLYGRFKKIGGRFSDHSRTLEKYITRKPVSIEELSGFYKRSAIIIDIPIAGQRGLGLRPIEAIGAKCKLITTNSSIKSYDFYNTNNIFILEKDYSNINLLQDWIALPYCEYPSELYHKYSIDGFLGKVLLIKNDKY